MKLSLLLFSANDERRYVKSESRKPHGPYVANAYEDVDSEEFLSVNMSRSSKSFSSAVSARYVDNLVISRKTLSNSFCF